MFFIRFLYFFGFYLALDVLRRIPEGIHPRPTNPLLLNETGLNHQGELVGVPSLYATVLPVPRLNVILEPERLSTNLLTGGRAVLLEKPNRLREHRGRSVNRLGEVQEVAPIGTEGQGAIEHFTNPFEWN